MAGDGLTREDIFALAEAFPVGASRAVLSMAEFPAWAIPETGYGNALEFWSKIAEQVAAGIMEDGRSKLLAAARRTYPHNPKFAGSPGGATGAWGRQVPLRVLVLGASPSDLPPVRADQESRAIGQAALADRITVTYAAAAQGTDIQTVGSFRPDIVHFVCHGEDDCLILNDVHGESDPVKADRVVDTLRFYRDSAGIALRGIVLAACDGRALAPPFADVADTVIGFSGKLSDPCGVAFAGQLYRRLNDTDDLAAAAREAAQLAAQFSAACTPVIASLIVLPDG